MKKQKNICFVAGKSGGHLIPALTIAQKLTLEDNNTKILLITTNSPLDKKIIKESNIKMVHTQLPLGKLCKNAILRYPILTFHLSLSFAKSLYFLIKHRPKKIISTGGLVSLPVCIAAFLLKIPIELFELNAMPGKAVKFLAPFATTIYTCFTKAINCLPKHKCKISQYPIRFSHSSHFNKKINEKKTKFTILVLGGSQGSLAINKLIKELVIKTPNIKQNIQIIHQTGTLDKTDWQTFYAKHNIDALAFDFTQNISDYYPLADIVVCRAGAGTLFETIFFKKRCITIPLEAKTTNHQVDNAKEIQKMYPNLVTMIRQNKQYTDLFIAEISKLITTQKHN